MAYLPHLLPQQTSSRRRGRRLLLIVLTAIMVSAFIALWQVAIK